MRIDIGEWQVRSFYLEDAEALAKYANNRNVWLNLRDAFPHPYRTEHAVAWLRYLEWQAPEIHFAIASADEVIGYIGLGLQTDVFRRSAEIGYWLGEPFWGRGIATAALQALTEYAFFKFNLLRLFAYVNVTNPASVRVLEKAGYVREGRLRKNVSKDGQVIDQFLYAMVRD